MNLRDGMVLHHGSYAPIESIDLARCAAGKDFGKGFYLTADADQARRFIKTSLRKAINTNEAAPGQAYGFVSSFVFRKPQGALDVFEFSDANEEWLWFVSLNRRSRLAKQLAPKVSSSLLGSDIVVGKIANDTTNPVITTYLNGLYGPIENNASAHTAISLLLPDRLKLQYCFLTQRAVDCLEPLEVKRYAC